MKQTGYERGLAVRKEVLGTAWVRRALDGAGPVERDLQEFLTRKAWGGVWTRPQRGRRTRSLLTIAQLAAQGCMAEWGLHVRATRRTGATSEEVRETRSR